MKREPLLSVIVPAFNVEPFLDKCLNSVISQTYKNLEILVVDDGSTDGSGKICDEYAEKDSRVKVIHQKNKGLSGARNIGTEMAKGEYIAYVDGDDWLDVHMYEILITQALQYNLDISRCCAISSYGLADRSGDHLITAEKGHADILFQGEDVFALYFNEFLCKVVWNAIYKKEIVKGIISPERCHSQDNYVSGMYLYRCKRLMLSSKPLYYYRENPNGTTSPQNLRRFDICICTAQLIHDLKSEGLCNDILLIQLYQKLARELFHFLRDENEKYKVRSIKRSLYRFIIQYLSLRRKLALMYIIKQRHIEIL
jgi:glycosyltransferase involved in cell wall biosynthesis